MNTQRTIISVGESSPIADLLDMVFRRGPELMRCGWGTSTRDCSKFTEDDDKRIAELHKQGHYSTQIAKIMGRSQSGVDKRLRSMGLPSHLISRAQSRRVKIAALLATGKTRKQVAREIGMSYTGLCHAISQMERARIEKAA